MGMQESTEGWIGANFKRGIAGIQGPRIWGSFWRVMQGNTNHQFRTVFKEGGRDLWMADLVRILKGEHRYTRTTESVRIFKGGWREPRTVESVRYNMGLINPYRQIPETVSKKRAVTWVKGISRKLFPDFFQILQFWAWLRGFSGNYFQVNFMSTYQCKNIFT